MISVDNRFIPVEFPSFHNVFDLYYKIIHSWNIEYAQNLRKFFNIFDVTTKAYLIQFVQEKLSEASKWSRKSDELRAFHSDM